VEVYLHLFLKSAVHGGEWSHSRPLCPLNRRLGAFRSLSGGCGYDRILLQLTDSISSVVRPVAYLLNRQSCRGNPLISPLNNNNNNNNNNKIGAAGTISKSFRKYVSNIAGKHKVKKLQKTAILATAHILRKVLM